MSFCLDNPYEYKRCIDSICIRRGKLCPCFADVEFRCSLGNCLPIEFKCDGLKQCLYGEDEKGCAEVLKEPQSTQSFSVATEPLVNTLTIQKDVKGISVPVVVVVSSLCLFLCVLAFIIVYIVVTRRNRRNTPREPSQSATNLLMKGYSQDDTDTITEEENGNPKSLRIMRHKECEPSSTNYLSERFSNNTTENELTEELIKTSEYVKANKCKFIIKRHREYEPSASKQLTDQELKEETIRTSGDGKTYEHISIPVPESFKSGKTDDTKAEDLDNEHITCKQNLALEKGVEIYGIDLQTPCQIQGLGRYIFKPRIQY